MTLLNEYTEQISTNVTRTVSLTHHRQLGVEKKNISLFQVFF